MAANTTGVQTQDAATAAARGFVVRNGSQLFHNGKPFYYVGANAYWFIDFYTLSWGREQIDEFLDDAQVRSRLAPHVTSDTILCLRWQAKRVLYRLKRDAGAVLQWSLSWGRE
jgi:hypothetical protein